MCAYYYFSVMYTYVYIVYHIYAFILLYIYIYVLKGQMGGPLRSRNLLTCIFHHCLCLQVRTLSYFVVPYRNVHHNPEVVPTPKIQILMS